MRKRRRETMTIRRIVRSFTSCLRTRKHFSRMRFALSCFVMAAIPGASALAAGGAHAVDDAEVVEAGRCEVETWATHYDPGASLFSVSATCSAKTLSEVEWTLAAARLLDEQTTLSAAFKWHWGRAGSSSIGLAGSVAVTSVKDGGAELGLIVPVTWEVTPEFRMSLNAGVIHATEGPNSLDGYVGGQAEVALTDGLDLMVEAFDRSRTEPGAQIGMRWSPSEARSTYDLLVGHRTDGESDWSVTLGWTLAF